ncbi:GntR family transcriptional regulator [Bacillus sp. sid0103]|uniref:GntR family transcriptional regulator n=1 Tax=Bacillus sp. sid0103 TaxID=2856337 RepID=UPI001C48C393|nr:GntR family transcriptional regulator [Bacillus sp. sid0103]MBV7509152.1 GntR family transcriptional regulator [Bacillus sp. sid0103]
MKKIETVLPLRDIAFEAIKKSILNYELLPGQAIYERDLSEKLGISRTPVRESLSLLEREKWIISKPRVGTFINEITEENVIEVMEIRMIFDRFSLEKICGNITLEQIKVLESYIEEQEKNKTDQQRFIELDKEFHSKIVLLTKNERLEKWFEEIGDQIRWFGLKAITEKSRIEETISEHKEIIKALKSQDINQLLKASNAHVENTKNKIINQLRRNSNEESN